MTMLSPHFRLSEAVYSATAMDRGIVNKPGAQALIYMALTANDLLEPLRELWGGVPLRLSSFYRSKALNNAIGGSKRSAHMEGRAVDIQAHNGLKTEEMYRMLSMSGIAYDKVIIEQVGHARWLHVQTPKIGAKARNIAMTAYPDPATGEIIYSTV